jgi:hypothetical protein
MEDALTAILARHPGSVGLVHGDCPHGADATAPDAPLPDSYQNAPPLT